MRQCKVAELLRRASDLSVIGASGNASRGPLSLTDQFALYDVKMRPEQFARIQSPAITKISSVV